MFPFLNNSKCLPNIRKLKFQRCSDAVSKRNQSFSNRWCPGTMPARISVGGSEGIFSITEGRGQLFFTQLFSMIKFSSAWYLLWSNHGCFILLSIFPVLDYLPSFISSSQLQGFLVADTWQFICMKDVSGWHLAIYMYEGCQPVSWSWIRSPICVFCVHGLTESLRQEGTSWGLWSKKGQSWVQTMLHKAMSTWVLKVSKVITSSW